MNTRIVIALLISSAVLFAEGPSFKKVDFDGDLRVNSTEHRKWSYSCSYGYSKGMESEYGLSAKLHSYVKRFDKDGNGRLSNLEFRRFQTESKKMFSAVEDLILKDYDTNGNKRLDKEEKEMARIKVESIIKYTFKLEIEKNEEGEMVIHRKRSITDLYD